MRLEQEMLRGVSTILPLTLSFGQRNHGLSKTGSIVGWDIRGCHGFLCFGLQRRARADQASEGTCLLRQEVTGETTGAFAQEGRRGRAIWRAGGRSVECCAQQQG